MTTECPVCKDIMSANEHIMALDMRQLLRENDLAPTPNEDDNDDDDDDDKPHHLPPIPPPSPLPSPPPPHPSPVLPSRPSSPPLPYNICLGLWRSFGSASNSSHASTPGHSLGSSPPRRSPTSSVSPPSSPPPQPSPSSVLRRPHQSTRSESRRTSFLCVSDTHEHGGNFQIPKEKVDVLLHSGDILKDDEEPWEQYERTVKQINKVNAGLKLLIAGNHDLPLDLDLEKRGQKMGQGFGRARKRQLRSDILQLFQDNNIVYLEEGQYEFSLENGARLKIFASPATIKRSGSYPAFAYTRLHGHCFDMDEDVDVVMSHGPPLSIRDPHEDKPKYRGDESLRHHVAMAKPKLHVFGHNHAGYGATLVNWKETDGVSSPATSVGEWKPQGVPRRESKVDEREEGREDIFTAASLYTNEAVLKNIVEKGCFRTSHGAQDDRPIEKGRNTLFVNACYSSYEAEQHRQLPILVDIDLPWETDPAKIGNGSRTVAPVPPQRRTVKCCAAYVTANPLPLPPPSLPIRSPAGPHAHPYRQSGASPAPPPPHSPASAPVAPAAASSELGMPRRRQGGLNARYGFNMGRRDMTNSWR